MNYNEIVAIESDAAELIQRALDNARLLRQKIEHERATVDVHERRSRLLEAKEDLDAAIDNLEQVRLILEAPEECAECPFVENCEQWRQAK